MAGLSDTGLEVRTQPELQELLEKAVHEVAPDLDLSQGPEHQFIGVLSEELALAWETLRALYGAPYPASAEGALLDETVALTGTRRRAATHSRVTCDVTLAAGATLPAGSIAAVENSPDSQFALVEEITNPGGTEAVVEGVFEALTAGPVAAPADELSVIVTAVTGWVSLTNPLAADLGEEVADDDELRADYATELAGRGTDSYAAIRAAVARLTGVEEVTVYGNETLATDGDGRPGKSIEVVVWDGDPAGAVDDEIAQAIWDAKPAGISLHSATADFGTAVDDAGVEHTVPFSRASELRTYVELTAVLEDGTGGSWATQVAAAIVARGATYRVGQTAYASQLVAAVIDDVDGIEAVPTLTLGTSPSPVGASVAPTIRQIVRIRAGDVDATEA
jgi:hypothetical protein